MNSKAEEKRGGKAVIVGGSIAGISCAHALISAGWEAVVVEKSAAPPAGSPTGAGLGLDPQSRDILCRWISDPKLLNDATLPLSIDLNMATESETKTSKILTRDEEFNFRAAHWADLHALLHRTLPRGQILWGHQFISFQISENKSKVTIKARIMETNEILEMEADLLVAADGCTSSIRQHFLPNFKLRYSGYCAWRGVLDFTGKEDSDLITGIKRAYPELGRCLYFDLAHKAHSVLYELENNRLNWLWYINMPEPELKASSVTMKVKPEMIEEMHEQAERVWVPQLASLMRETSEPFINVIYDSEPLNRIIWGHVVLVGDAAHPTTPHGLRSTNMSIVDAHVLGTCLGKFGLDGLDGALDEFQSIRLPVVSAQVLHARKLGQIKQGLDLKFDFGFDLKSGDLEKISQLQQRNMPYFDGAPTAS